MSDADARFTRLAQEYLDDRAERHPDARLWPADAAPRDAARVLKGKFSNSLAAVSLRKGLVVFQFMISVTLIVSTVVMKQEERTQSRKLRVRQP